MVKKVYILSARTNRTAGKPLCKYIPHRLADRSLREQDGILSAEREIV